MTIDTKAIRAALEAATPGPFRRWKQRVCRADDKGGDSGVFMAWNGEQDASLLVLPLNTAPALLSAAEENERLRQENKLLRAERNSARRAAMTLHRHAGERVDWYDGDVDAAEAFELVERIGDRWRKEQGDA